MIITAEQDVDAPNVGVPQQRIMTQPNGQKTRTLMVMIHGSQSDAGAYFHAGPDNNPNFPGQYRSRRREFTQKLGSLIPTVAHDFAGINPVTGVLDGQQFGSKAVMDLIDAQRTTVAPRLDCDPAKLFLLGGSQGSGDCLQYLLQWPSRVRAVVLVSPGADLEWDRLGTSQVNINQNWGRASTQTLSLTLGVGGPDLRLGGSAGLAGIRWSPGRAFVTNDVVVPDVSSPAVNGWRCVNSHTSTGATIPYADTSKWLPLDPLSVHYSVPSEGGTSLAFQSGSPLAGQPANYLEPANIQRFRDIVSGRLTGTPVPVFIYYSAGDFIAMATGTNGVTTGTVPWFGAQIGARLTKVSDVYNHSADQGAIQPLDPQWQTTASLTTGSVKCRPGTNGTVIFRLQGLSGVVVFEATTDPAGLTGWVSNPAHVTVPVRASAATEGPDVTTTNASGYWRMDASGFSWARVRRSVGAGVVTVTCGPSYAPDVQIGGVDPFDVGRRLLAA